MKSIMMAVLRWPMYSVPRFVLTLVVVVGIGLGLNALDTPEEGPHTVQASTTPAPSDGGGEDDALPAQRDPQQLATATVEAFVTRETPDSNRWAEETAPYMADDVLEGLEESPWEPAEDAPVTAQTVSINGGLQSINADADAWSGTVTARTSSSAGEARHQFTVEASRDAPGEPWMITKLEEVQDG